MPLENHHLIEAWSEDELLQLPEGETDEYEYKSSPSAKATIIAVT
jgi:hypothetical protein